MQSGQPVRQSRTVTFPEANHEDERIGAVLVVKDADTGALKAYVRDVEGKQGPDPEIVAALVQSYEITNL